MSSPSRGAPVSGEAPQRRKRGRPRIERDEELQLNQTRIPEQMRGYLKAIAAYRYDTLIKMHEAAFRRFLEEKPYEQGLQFRIPRTVSDTGWVQVNLLLPETLSNQVRADAALLGVSLASYTYTVLYWWATYVYPPQAS
ncbi:hypothetical protein [Ramlibacter alkalitolerans]|uniref:Uncharacterized protein n=1 Tax=Ramlibacter alkalitolerans TaxID=2039631 RepID=A0ABS1JUH3_9BURK|nr:hypothetical protein [Ramlibacter alkalitolerans]MBL0427806.1 hypothetical protein [Ramlibacter alkalitolerans]